MIEWLGHVLAAIGAGLLGWFLVWLRLEWIAVSARSRALKDLPGPSYGLTGILKVLAEEKDIHRVATDWANSYGPIFRVRVMQFHIVVITDPALATFILRSRLLDKFRFQYGFLDPFLGGLNLLTGPTDEHWKAVRKGVAPAFAAGNIRDAFGAVVERCEMLAGVLREWGPDKIVNVDDMLLREAMDVIGRVGFEKEMGALEAMRDGTEEKVSAVQLMLACTHEMFKRFKEVHRDKTIWRSDVRNGRSLMMQWRNIIREELLCHMKKIVPRKNTFAQLLLATKDPKTGQPLTDAQMLPEIAALFFAGSDTTGHTGTWILYILSQYPEVEAKVLAELDSLGLLVTAERPNPRSMVFADLGRMPYLQAVIKEVLRMYPPVGAGFIRVNEERDVTLCDGRLNIPKGTLLWIPAHGLQNVTFNWDRPEEFLPERWFTAGTEYAERLPMPAEFYEGWYDVAAGGPGVVEDAVDPDEIAKESQRAKRYIPFSEGARNCVGQQLAKVSLQATAACLISRFHFKLADQMGGAEGVRSREQYTLVTGIDGGMHMHAIPRGVAA